MALDVGDRRVGIAVGDTEAGIAMPLSVYVRVGGRRDPQALAHAAADQKAEALLVGMPLSLDGSRGDQALRVERFCEALRRETVLPVLVRDERFTTVEADRQMMGAAMSSQKRKAMRDAAAAAVLLQSYFDNAAPRGADTIGQNAVSHTGEH